MISRAIGSKIALSVNNDCPCCSANFSAPSTCECIKSFCFFGERCFECILVILIIKADIYTGCGYCKRVCTSAKCSECRNLFCATGAGIRECNTIECTVSFAVENDYI